MDVHPSTDPPLRMGVAAMGNALPLVIDWAAVLGDLRACGLAVGRVADRLGVGRSTVRGWADGAYPKHHDGEALLALWTAQTGKPRASAPLRPLLPSASQVLAQCR